MPLSIFRAVAFLLLGTVCSYALSISSPRQAHIYEYAASDEDLIGMWDGRDEDAESNTQVELVNRSGAKASGKQLRILGMFDSGTNVLSKTVQLNFGDSITQVPKWIKPGQGHSGPPGMTEEFSLQLWKHSPPVSSGVYAGWMDNIAAQVNKLGGTVVVMIRNPISQLTSLKKAPYNLEGCMRSAFTYTDKGCSFDVSPWRYVPPHDFPVPGPMGVWNEYVRGYVELAKRHSNVMLVRYEDLVMNPEAVMQQIASRMELPAPSPVRIVGASAKNHGESVGRSAAIRKIKQHSHLDMYDMRAHLEKVCKGLQRDLDVQIPSTPPPNGPDYFSDCDGLGQMNSTIR